MRLKINATTVTVDVEPDMPLLWVLRDELALTGTKFGCGIAQCGACTVLIDDVPVRSCAIPVSAVAGQVTTIEGIGTPDNLHAVQSAWIEHQVAQCGYCQSGQIMVAISLLAKNPDPGDSDIDASMRNICRCGTYARIRAAIHTAAKKLQTTQS